MILLFCCITESLSLLSYNCTATVLPCQVGHGTSLCIAKQNSSLKLQSKDNVSQEYTLISLTNMSDEAQAAPQAFLTHADMAQALVGKTFSQMSQWQDNG